MRKTISLGLLLLLIVWLASCSQRASTPYHPYAGKGDREYSANGVASWYGPSFQGRRTASGERYDMDKLTAAHRTLPFGAYVRVTNLNNDKSVVVKINDRGPYAKNRLIDLSREAARRLDIVASGTARVHLEWIDDPSAHPPATTQAVAAATAEDSDPSSPADVTPATTADEPSDADLIAKEISKDLEQTE